MVWSHGSTCSNSTFICPVRTNRKHLTCHWKIKVLCVRILVATCRNRFKYESSKTASVVPRAERQLYSYSRSSLCWDIMYCTLEHMAHHCLAAPTCSLRWLNQTNLIVCTVSVGLLDTVMPVYAERPFVIPADFQLPAMCLEKMNSFCFFAFLLLFGVGESHMCRKTRTSANMASPESNQDLQSSQC